MSEQSRALAQRDAGAVIEQVVIQGDLSKLQPTERVQYYREVCQSLGLNPLTKPFDYITLNGRLTLYAKRDATDQLRARHKVSVTIVARERIEDIYVVTARATTPDGRSDESIGAVNIKGTSGDALANALMKAETKAKRRATLSLVGLGWLDETEIETIPGARIVSSDESAPEPTPTPIRPAASAPTQHPTLPCESEQCAGDGRILARQIGKTVYTAQQIAERTRAKYGKAFCWACAERERARAEARAEEDDAPTEAQIDDDIPAAFA